MVCTSNCKPLNEGSVVPAPASIRSHNAKESAKESEESSSEET